MSRPSSALRTAFLFFTLMLQDVSTERILGQTPSLAGACRVKAQPACRVHDK